MRDIKFRGIYNGKFVYGNLIILHFPDRKTAQIENADFNEFRKWEVDIKTVGQFTGLKDKNGKGKLIYHKDLIVNQSRNDGSPHIVEWSDKFGGWVGLYRGLEYLIEQELNEIELVGNIFENAD